MATEKNMQPGEDEKEYGYTQQLKNRVRAKLLEVLTKHNRLDLLEMVYPVAAELIINAAKAMMKRIVFSENKLNLDNPADWEKGTAIFKEKLTEKYIGEYLKKGLALNYWIKVRYVHNRDGLRFEVINNTPIPHIDEERLRARLANAMRYTNLADYYFDQADQKEGEGIGIGLIVIMLANQGIDPGYLRIGTIGEQTVARIEIPFTKHYKPYRDLKFETVQNFPKAPALNSPR